VPSVRERLSDPTAWATILRHAVPVFGVLVAGWSALETLVSLVLDAVSVLACAAAIGSTLAVRSFAHDRQGWIDRANLVAGGVVIFVLVTALLLFAIGVPAAALWLVALRGNEDELWRLAGDPWLQASFAAMVACQIPRWLAAVRTLDAETARRALAPEVGYVLVRFVVVASAAGALALLPPRLALLGALVVVQGVLAGTELLADQYLAWLARDEATARDPAARTATGARRRRRRR